MLRYHVEVHPVRGFKRPQYFNERDRRLRGDEGSVCVLRSVSQVYRHIVPEETGVAMSAVSQR
jgi:hypothetical protein